MAWRFIMQEVAIWSLLNCGHEEMHQVINNTHRLWHSSNDLLVLMDQLCAKKIFHKPSHRLYQPELHQCVSRNQDPSDHAMFLQLWWVSVHCSLRFLFLRLTELKSIMVFCCFCNDCCAVNSEMLFLFTTIVQICRLVSSLLISFIKNAFPSTDLLLTGCFFSLLSKLSKILSKL